MPKKFGRYFEAFVGGGAVFFALRPQSAVLGDSDNDLINCYEQIRDRPDKVIRYLASLRNDAGFYYRFREQKPRTSVARAGRIIYFSTLAFNGIYRLNHEGRFNVPYGQKAHLKVCDKEHILAVSSALETVTLKASDFEIASREAEPGDLVYFDPPYTVAHRNNGFLKYNARIFSWEDQKRLAECAYALARRGCHVVVSNADHDSIHKLYRYFRVHRLLRASNMASRAESRRTITECLFINR